MRLTIIRDDNLVIVDGRPLRIDCSALPQSVSAVQWYGDHGEVETTDGDGRRANLAMQSMDDYQSLVDAWQAEADRLSNLPPPPPPPVSRRQMLTALVLSGFVTEVEASSATDIPAAVAAVIDTLVTEQERVVARMKWRTFQEARRDDPLVSGLAASKRMTDAQVDDLFALAASL